MGTIYEPERPRLPGWFWQLIVGWLVMLSAAIGALWIAVTYGHLLPLAQTESARASDQAPAPPRRPPN